VSRRVFLARARSYLPWLEPGHVTAAPAATASLAIAEQIAAQL